MKIFLHSINNNLRNNNIELHRYLQSISFQKRLVKTRLLLSDRDETRNASKRFNRILKALKNVDKMLSYVEYYCDAIEESNMVAGYYA
jgi:hypothetical protein